MPVSRYEERGRAAKVSRFTMAFDQVVRDAGQDPTTPATAKEIVRQLTEADEARWAQLAADLGEKAAPSPTTREQIVAHYQHIANKAHQVGPDVIGEPTRFAMERGDVRVTATWDRFGFTWSIYVSGEFKRGGYTRGQAVEKAFTEAFTQAKEGP